MFKKGEDNCEGWGGLGPHRIRYMSLGSLAVLALLLSSCMATIGSSEVSEAASVIDSGVCGDNLTWTLYDDGLLEIVGTGGMYDYWDGEESPWYPYRGQICTLNIGEGVASIGDCAFYDCTPLQSVTIPSSVTSIGYAAFDWCTSLQSVDFGNDSMLEYIGNYAFYDCTSLQSVTIPDSVTYIGDAAFSNCDSLRSVDFSDDSMLEYIEYQAFAWCTSLQSVTIPDSVIYVGDEAFYGITFYDTDGVTQLSYQDLPGYTYRGSDGVLVRTPAESSDVLVAITQKGQDVCVIMYALDWKAVPSGTFNLKANYTYINEFGDLVSENQSISLSYKSDGSSCAMVADSSFVEKLDPEEYGHVFCITGTYQLGSLSGSVCKTAYSPVKV